MDPAISDGKTVLTAIGAWRDSLNLIDMSTLFGHNSLHLK
jgi:hypothetical protein